MRERAFMLSFSPPFRRHIKPCKIPFIDTLLIPVGRPFPLNAPEFDPSKDCYNVANTKWWPHSLLVDVVFPLFGAGVRILATGVLWWGTKIGGDWVSISSVTAPKGQINIVVHDVSAKTGTMGSLICKERMFWEWRRNLGRTIAVSHHCLLSLQGKRTEQRDVAY